MFRARVCIEGVPDHARQAATVAQLFSAPLFIEEVNHTIEKEENKSTFNLLIWTASPSDLAIAGTLQIEEPIQFSDEYYLRVGNMELPHIRETAVKMLNYEVLIHLDRVIDFSPLPSPDRQSFDTDISGQPNDEPTVQWPVTH
ncbi:hypothetical protein HU200_062608 [Digitaria exilis]|uniref:Uncharacterized protein n=1 Tax=Digitaria exilis TaxID=1010633 RepID=A0A835A7J3_9POAL|nr:hypothetical protein HU200_062608 [Digitaria exilis]